MADGGTLFLDDIDDVPLSMQVKLLRVLQNRTIERLGGTRTVPVNVRIIAGSKRDLQQMVAEGKFREDLFYRLNVLPLTLPPLRERREDIPALVDHFIERYFRRKRRRRAADLRRRETGVPALRWPGNVRELENACERIAQMCTCGTVRDWLRGGQRAAARRRPSRSCRRPRHRRWRPAFEPVPTPRAPLKTHRSRSTIACANSKPA